MRFKKLLNMSLLISLDGELFSFLQSFAFLQKEEQLNGIV
jgi:hypothetical protein